MPPTSPSDQRPPVPYFGGKTSLAPWIVDLLPAHQHYVEPFAGSLAVLLAKPPARAETVNDLDNELVTFWRVLRDRPEELIRACALTPHARAEFAAAWTPSEDDVEIARRVWVRLAQGRSGILRTTGWRYQIKANGSTSMPRYLDRYRVRLIAAAERLMSVSIECRPALDVIAAYGASPDSLLYVDPPYLGSTRARSSYRHEMQADDQHRELAEALRATQATVVLSGYDSPLYDELYTGWHRYTTATWTGNATANKARVEVLWSNRPLTSQAELSIWPRS
jgi:DNA adenine methylase